MPGGRRIVEITSRTIQSRFLLRPSEELKELVLGVLGKALAMDQHQGVRLLAFVFVSNHYVMLLEVDDTEAMSNFVGYVNGNIAKEAGRLCGWKDKFWGRRFKDIPVLDEETQVGRLRYVMAHGVKEGLVERAEIWPGATCLPALLRGEKLEGVWFSRTDEYNARRRGKEFEKYEYATTCEVPLSPLPCWAHLTEQQRQVRCTELVADIEREALLEIRSHCLGLKRVLEQDPHGVPAHTKHSPAPLCHAATRAVRDDYLEAIALVRTAYREAAERVKAGRIAEVEFPHGCFPPPLPFVQEPPGQGALSP